MAKRTKPFRRAVRKSRQAVGRLRDFRESLKGPALNKLAEQAKVDPRISYPCYKSLDDYIDVEKLKSLDGYLKEKIAIHMKTERLGLFETGLCKLKLFSPTRPGSKCIPLAVSTQETYKYFDLEKPDLWQRSRQADDFGLLMDFIDTLPFKATARMVILFDEKGRAVTPHRDHPHVDHRHEFIWFRTNLDKPFYMLNHKTKKKEYVQTYSAWFDTVNQFHGSDPTGRLSISLRVDGVFTDEFRAQMPTPPYNAASTAALWACLSNGVNGEGVTA